MELTEINNTLLRRKKIIFGCRSSSIGNNHCDAECRHPITGDDGGDCKPDKVIILHIPCIKEGAEIHGI